MIANLGKAIGGPLGFGLFAAIIVFLLVKRCRESNREEDQAIREATGGSEAQIELPRIE